MEFNRELLDRISKYFKNRQIVINSNIMKIHKKFREKVFLLLISRIKENKVKNEKDTYARKKQDIIYKDK